MMRFTTRFQRYRVSYNGNIKHGLILCVSVRNYSSFSTWKIWADALLVGLGLKTNELVAQQDVVSSCTTSLGPISTLTKHKPSKTFFGSAQVSRAEERGKRPPSVNHQYINLPCLHDGAQNSR